MTETYMGSEFRPSDYQRGMLEIVGGDDPATIQEGAAAGPPAAAPRSAAPAEEERPRVAAKGSAFVSARKKLSDDIAQTGRAAVKTFPPSSCLGLLSFPAVAPLCACAANQLQARHAGGCPRHCSHAPPSPSPLTAARRRWLL